MIVENIAIFEVYGGARDLCIARPWQLDSHSRNALPRAHGHVSNFEKTERSKHEQEVLHWLRIAAEFAPSLAPPQ